MPLRFHEAGWTYYPPTRIPYEDVEAEPEPAYSFSWPHNLIYEVNVLILSKRMDPLKAIQAIEKKYLRRKQKTLNMTSSQSDPAPPPDQA